MPARRVLYKFCFLTIKLDRIEMRGDIGKNFIVTMQAEPWLGRTWEEPAHPVVSFTLNSKAEFIAQAHWDPIRRTISPKIKVNVVEKDPVHNDIASTTIFLNGILKKCEPERGVFCTGTQRETLTIRGKGGDVKKKAELVFHLSWYVNPSVYEVVKYIAEEMKTNAASNEAREIKEEVDLVRKYGPEKAQHYKVYAAGRGLIALKKWADMVKFEGPWDHKSAIYSALGTWTFDPDTGTLFHAEIWSNLHYGYVGRKIGFSENTLLEGAGAAQGGAMGRLALLKGNAKTYDEEEDQQAIKIGMGIAMNSSPLSPKGVLTRVRRAELNEKANKKANKQIIPDKKFKELNKAHYDFPKRK